MKIKVYGTFYDVSFQMTRYKHTEFNDEDTSSVGSIHLNEATSPAMHIRYHSVRVRFFLRGFCTHSIQFIPPFLLQTSSIWTNRSLLEKCLISLVFLLLLIVIILALVLATGGDSKSTRILHVQPHTKGRTFSGA